MVEDGTDICFLPSGCRSPSAILGRLVQIMQQIAGQVDEHLCWNVRLLRRSAMVASQIAGARPSIKYEHRQIETADE